MKRYAHRVGLDPASYGGHSLRSGFLTSAAESGASIWKLSEVSGYVARLRAARRSVQGARGGRVPVTAEQITVLATAFNNLRVGALLAGTIVR